MTTVLYTVMLTKLVFLLLIKKFLVSFKKLIEPNVQMEPALTSVMSVTIKSA
jgi:hypothetical protein